MFFDDPFAQRPFLDMINDVLFYLHSLIPLITGIKDSRTAMPTTPSTIPTTIFPHTMLRHMPAPKTNDPTMPSTGMKIVLPEI